MDPEGPTEPPAGLAPPDLALAVAQASLVTALLLVPVGVAVLGIGMETWSEGSALDGLSLLGPRARPLQLAGACFLLATGALAWRRARIPRPPIPWLTVAEKSQIGAAGAVLGVWCPHLLLFGLGETEWLGSPTLVLLGASAGAGLTSAAAFHERLAGGAIAGALGGGSGTLLGYFLVGCPMVLLGGLLADLLGLPLLVAVVGALVNGCIAGGSLLAIRALAELFDLE